jgi:hypothetical protein
MYIYNQYKGCKRGLSAYDPTIHAHVKLNKYKEKR